MMQDNQNTLFINEHDVRNAVIYDREWVRRRRRAGRTRHVDGGRPAIRGHQWQLRMTQPGPDVVEVELPEDLAERGRIPPPLMPPNAFRIGTDLEPAAPASTERS